MEITAALSLRINISEETVTHIHHINACHGNPGEETAACAVSVTLLLCLSAVSHVSEAPRLSLFIIDDRWALRPGEGWAPPAAPVLLYTHSHIVTSPADLGKCACLCVRDAKQTTKNLETAFVTFCISSLFPFTYNNLPSFCFVIYIYSFPVKLVILIHTHDTCSLGCFCRRTLENLCRATSCSADKDTPKKTVKLASGRRI